MKLRLEATAIEMATKGEDLLKAIAEELQDHRPDLADAVRKALGEDVLASAALSPALAQLEEASTRAYQAMLKRMLADIDKVLDDAVGGFGKSVDDNARVKVIDRLAQNGVARTGLAALSLPELLQKAAALP